MGSSIDGKLLQQLHDDPDLITWSGSRHASLTRGHARRLGIKIHTYEGKKETFTIVTKVKPECHIDSGYLQVLDRITCVNQLDIVLLSEEQVLNLFKTYPGNSLSLTVCKPRVFKSNNSTHSSQESCTSSLKAQFSSSSKEPGNSSLEFCSKSVLDTWRSSESVCKLSSGSESKVLISEPSTTSGSDLSLHCFQSSELLSGNSECETSFRDQCEIVRKSGSEKFNSAVREKGSDDVTETGSVSKTIKRGISQVSGSSSNQSDPGRGCEPQMRRVMGKPKESLKPAKRAGKFTPSDSANPEELEPLHFIGPVPTQHGLRPDSRNCQLSPESSSSMPVLNETAVSMQDIVFLEDNGASSLPSQTVISSHVSSCQCATCSSTSTEHRSCCICGNSPQKMSSPGVSFTIDSSQDQLSEDYSSFLLKNPHLAVWDGKNTHVVEIDRGQGKEFGFTFKVKIGKNQDTSVEVYTLVEAVERQGPAREKLKVGDWIRSVNGTPIQQPNDAFTNINNKDHVLRLVIQRPVGFSQQPPSLRIDSSDKGNTDLSSQTSPQTCSPSGWGEQNPLMSGAVAIPGIIEPKKGPERKVLPVNIYIGQADQNSETKNESSVQVPPFPKTVKFPKVRLFICGGEADKFANFILRNSESEVDFRQSGYAYSLFAMATDCYENIVTSSPCTNLSATSNLSSPYSPSHQTDSKSSVNSKCRHCGSDLNSCSAQSASSVVNIEMFVAADDSFFHNCCNYLFTKSSIFILTFNCEKMLRSSAVEFSRLQNLSHTIRSFAGDDCHIMSCGMLESGTETRNMADEVRALFYTPLNTQLQNFNVFGPELVSAQSTSSSANSFMVNKQFRRLLWKIVTETIQRQRVLHPSLLVSDYLHTIRGREIFLTESKLMDIIKAKMPNYGVDVHQVVLTYLIMNGEILLGKATPFINPKIHKTESLVVLDPRIVLDKLHAVVSVIADDKQMWNKTHSTGFIGTGNLASFLGETESQAQYFIDFMESLGLIFKRPSADSVSHEHFLPYFLQVPSSMACPVSDKKDNELYLTFTEHEASQTFLRLVFAIGAASDSPGSLIMQMGNCCSVLHRGILVSAYHEKVEDRVKFLVRREDKTCGTSHHDLYSWLHSICKRSLGTQFLLGVPCPLGENCRRGGQSGIHVVDINETRPQYCGNERVDQQKRVRIWRQKEESTSQAAGKQPVSVMDLGWTVFHKMCMKLRVSTGMARDWRGLADLMGYSTEEVNIYETFDEPEQRLLRDWSKTREGTISNLAKFLEELEREDVLMDLRPYLPASRGSQPESTTQRVAEAVQSRNGKEVEGQGQDIRLNDLDKGDSRAAEGTETPVECLQKANLYSDS